MTAIDSIEGIGSAHATTLRQHGIATVEQLLEQAGSRGGRERLEKATGISGKQILRWVNHADLYRIKGVAGEMAELLEAAGVDSVAELARRDPANLHQKMGETNEAKRLVRRPPAAAQVAAWVEEAKTLDRKVTH